MKESYIKKDTILDSTELDKYGYTDISLIFASRRKGSKLITGDYRLYSKCKELGINCMHMNEIVEMATHFIN